MRDNRVRVGARKRVAGERRLVLSHSARWMVRVPVWTLADMYYWDVDNNKFIKLKACNGKNALNSFTVNLSVTRKVQRLSGSFSGTISRKS